MKLIVDEYGRHDRGNQHVGSPREGAMDRLFDILELLRVFCEPLFPFGKLGQQFTGEASDHLLGGVNLSLIATVQR